MPRDLPDLVIAAGQQRPGIVGSSVRLPPTIPRPPVCLRPKPVPWVTAPRVTVPPVAVAWVTVPWLTTRRVTAAWIPALPGFGPLVASRPPPTCPLPLDALRPSRVRRSRRRAVRGRVRRGPYRERGGACSALPSTHRCPSRSPLPSETSAREPLPGRVVGLAATAGVVRMGTFDEARCDIAVTRA